MSVKRKTSEAQKDFNIHLATKNISICVRSAMVMCLALPAGFIVYQWFHIGLNGRFAVAMCVALELVQYVMLGVGMWLLKKNEFDKMTITYRIYYTLTILMLMSIGIGEIVAKERITFVLVGLCYYAFVPIYSKNEQKVVQFAMAIMAAASFVLAYGTDLGLAFDVAGMALGAIFVAKYHSDMMRRNEKVSEELRKKTITAEQDPLTGLTNRRGLSRRANTLWPYCARAKSSVGIIALDIDFFKKYNDKYGHPEGDKCLMKISDAIRKSARRGTDITARIGGEEFLVFVQDMSKEEIIALALKIRNAIADLKIPHSYVGVSQYVTVSMGVAVTVPDGLNSFHALYEEADQALYAAKDNGRNCVVCDDIIYGRMKNGLGTAISL